jgi:hypothetical protein
MARLSSAAWIVHDVGLAASIGGTMFGRRALQPALHELPDRAQRDRVSDAAWRRFSWINLAGHAAVAATWWFGRTMLTGRSVSRNARRLAIAKDALIVASLATGIASVVLGRVLGKRVNGAARSEPRVLDERGVAVAAHGEHGSERLREVVGAVGIANLITNVGVAAVTTALAMEASQSLPFSLVSRRLP